MLASEIRDGMFSPETLQAMIATKKWANESILAIQTELDGCNTPNRELQLQQQLHRIQKTLDGINITISGYRECTCGSGILWNRCGISTYCG